MENPKHVFTGQIFNSYYQNNELKMKVRWVGARKKKWDFFYHLFCSQEINLAFYSMSVHTVLNKTFKIYIHSHTKTHYFIRLFACF